MRLLRTLLVAALTFSTVAAHADDKTAITRLTDLLNQPKALTAHFSQLSLDSGGNQLQETKGDMAMQRPGLLNWHTDAPQEQIIVSDGKKVWLYDPDLKQVTIKPLDQRLSQTPALLLSGDISKISESFVISYKESGGIVDFVLKPKDKDTLFDSLRLSFRSGILNDMQLIDSVGQRTNILFTGVDNKANLDRSKFQFVIPPGTDVIEE